MADRLEKKIQKNDLINDYVEDFVLFRECVGRDPLPDEQIAIDSFASSYVENRDKFNLESYGLRATSGKVSGNELIPKPEVTLQEIYSAYAASQKSLSSQIDKSLLSESGKSDLETLCSKKTDVLRRFDFEEQMIALGYVKTKNHYRKENSENVSYVFPEGISAQKNCNERFGLEGSFSFIIDKAYERKFVKTVEKIDDTQVTTAVGSIIGLGFSFVPALIFGAEPETLGFALSIGGSFGLGSYLGHAFGKHIARNATECLNLDYLKNASHSVTEYDCSILPKRIE